MEIREEINAYWSKRADEFGDARYTDMQGEKHEKWKALIKSFLPEKKEIRALDLGTGAGFFSFILSELGCKVTGIDYSEDMLRNAHANSKKLGFKDIEFLRMDAQALEFADASFDFIFTRNVTWTLPDPEKAYNEMMRVLAPGGRLMNADANYAAGFKVMDETGQTERFASKGESKYEHPATSLDMLKERNRLARSLYIADEYRPVWDLKVMLAGGLERIWIEFDVNRNVFGVKMPPDAPRYSPEFVIVGEKISL